MAQTKKVNQQRLWLNVIIIATAFMILLFTVVGKLMEDKSPAATVETPFADLTELRIGNWHVKQTNQQCQQSQQLLSTSECFELIQHWQSFKPTAWLSKKNSPVVLSIVMTFQPDPSRQTGPSNHQQFWQLQLADRPKLSYQAVESEKSKTRNPNSTAGHAMTNDILLTDKQLSLLFPRALLTKWLPQ